MRNVICCWCNSNADDFENHVPLCFSGLRNQELGFENGIDVLFLSGFELLSKDYKRRLREVGYEVHDVSEIYRGLADTYPALNQFGDYEKKCFLRWPIISSYFSREQIIHYDGDVVFNEAPAVISGLVHGKTFVLQGCPVLTAIHDVRWFDQYHEQLDRFTADIRGYSGRAWEERKGWETSEREKWAGQRFREIISSDQDLLSHLIHTDRIVQDRPSEIMRTLQSYMLFENPLFLHGYDNNLSHAQYERISGVDYINGKRILIWHMQSDFSNYLDRFIFRKKYFGNRLRRLRYDGKKDFDRRLYDLLAKYVYGKINTRLSINRYFFERADFSEILNDHVWWQKGAFA